MTVCCDRVLPHNPQRRGASEWAPLFRAFFPSFFSFFPANRRAFVELLPERLDDVVGAEEAAIRQPRRVVRVQCELHCDPNQKEGRGTRYHPKVVRDQCELHCDPNQKEGGHPPPIVPPEGKRRCMHARPGMADQERGGGKPGRGNQARERGERKEKG